MTRERFAWQLFKTRIADRPSMVKRSQMDLTPQAKQVWEFLWPDEPWPDNIFVRWSRRLSSSWGLHWLHKPHGIWAKWRHDITINLTAFEHLRVMVAVYNLADGQKTGPLTTMVHELLHARGMRKHNAVFRLTLRACLTKLGIVEGVTCRD